MKGCLVYSQFESKTMSLNSSLTQFQFDTSLTKSNSLFVKKGDQ